MPGCTLSTDLPKACDSPWVLPTQITLGWNTADPLTSYRVPRVTPWVSALTAELFDKRETSMTIPLPLLKPVLPYRSVRGTRSACVPPVRMMVTEAFVRHIIQSKPLTYLWVEFLLCVICVTGERGRKQDKSLPAFNTVSKATGSEVWIQMNLWLFFAPEAAQGLKGRFHLMIFHCPLVRQHSMIKSWLWYCSRCLKSAVINSGSSTLTTFFLLGEKLLDCWFFPLFFSPCPLPPPPRPGNTWTAVGVWMQLLDT